MVASGRVNAGVRLLWGKGRIFNRFLRGEGGGWNIASSWILVILGALDGRLEEK